MKAARFHNVNQPLLLEQIPVPSIGPQDVLVQVKATGICGSDLHIVYEGSPTGHRPITLGHEPSGIIAEVGSKVTGFKPGDRVIVFSVVNCGRCPDCLTGRPTICAEGKIIGIDTDGAMAEYMVAPAKQVLHLPDNIPFEQGAILSDAVATPYHAITKRGLLKKGEKVAIIGCGGLGYHAVQLCKILGASQIIAVDADEEALKRTERVGATHLVVAGGNHLGKQIRELSSGGVNLALEFVGLSSTISLGGKILSPGGRLVVSGVGQEKIIMPPAALFAWREYSLIGSFSCEIEDIAHLINLAATGVLDVSGSITEKFPLEEAHTAMEHLHHKIGKPIRIVIQV